VHVDLEPDVSPVSVWGNSRCQLGRGSMTVNLEPYGYAWYRIEPQ
jgi:hypothetical protein